MRKTKDRILDTALRLFNKHGLAKITLRTIANEMNISQGNLNYHFRKREDIITELYFSLVQRIDKKMEEVKQEGLTLKALMDVSQVIMLSFYEYRFFMLDFVQIMRENNAVKLHYLKLAEARKSDFLNLFMILVKQGIMREEELTHEYLYLYDRIQIIGDFWISSAEVTRGKLSDKDIANYSIVITQAIYPYLTSKGKKEFLTLQ